MTTFRKDVRTGTELTFEDTVTIATTKEQLWELLSDPAVLAACLPGAENVERVNERRYTVEVARGISRLTLSISGEIELVEMDEPDWVLAEGTAYDSKTATDFEGVAAMEVASVDDELVDLRYEAHLTFTGGNASLSPRLLRSVVKSDVDRYFENVRAEVAGRSTSETT